MDPGAIFLCNMDDYHKYCCFLITPECQHFGPGKLQEVQPWSQRQHPQNKLFSVIHHHKEISLPTPSCCLLAGRWSWELVGCCCQLLMATLWFPPPLVLLLQYNHKHTLCHQAKQQSCGRAGSFPPTWRCCWLCKACLRKGNVGFAIPLPLILSTTQSWKWCQDAACYPHTDLSWEE